MMISVALINLAFLAGMECARSEFEHRISKVVEVDGSITIMFRGPEDWHVLARSTREDAFLNLSISRDGERLLYVDANSGEYIDLIEQNIRTGHREYLGELSSLPKSACYSTDNKSILLESESGAKTILPLEESG